MKIVVCGGGNLGHVLTGILSLKNEVSILTGNPEKWNKQIIINDLYGNNYYGNIYNISNSAKDLIPGCDIILLCVPGNIMEKYFNIIKEYYTENQIICSIVSSNGFFWMAKKILGSKAKLIGFQRVPYICRLNEYGHSATITGYKTLLKIAEHNVSNVEYWRAFFENNFNTKVNILNHYLEAAITNSNPLLHPSRLYGLFKRWNDKIIYDREFYFYEDWDYSSSEILILVDNEFQEIIRKLPINQNEIPSLLEYYESNDAISLTKKIKSIIGFKNIKAPMIKHNNGYIPDLKSRYFIEDIPYGLLIIKSIGLMLKHNTPVIDEIINWAQKVMKKEYLKKDLLIGNDIKETGIPYNYGINTIENLINLYV